MGMHVHSLGELPTGAERGYYVYILDYGWREPIEEALRSNFQHMANLASRSDAVVLQGMVGCHFEDEVLSWHHINGQDPKDLLPAMLITTRHPNNFRMHFHDEPGAARDHLLLIPLRKCCENASDVVKLIEKVFRDISEKKALADFEIAEEMKAGERGAITDALILQPNFSGVGIDLKRLVAFFRRRTG